MTQLILLAHGSRDPRWCRTFSQGLAIINQHLDRHASLAYMEMASPGLEQVIRDHYQHGKVQFSILPLFFAAGRHLFRDVPEQIRALEQELPGVQIQLLEAAGMNPGFWEFLGKMIATNEYGA